MRRPVTLADELRARIRREGPLRFDRYMEACLAAYYGRGPAIGPDGDFSTSVRFPAFRDAIARLVERSGMPRVVELGAGTGELARDIMGRGLGVEYVTVDASPALRARQEAAGARAVASTREIEPGPTLVFGNEVLDALHARRIVGAEGTRRGRDSQDASSGPHELLEVHVGVDVAGRFVDRLLPCPDADVAARLREEEVWPARGQIFDLQMGTEAFIAEAARLADPGYLVLIDYGDVARALFAPERLNGTLAAYRAHGKNHDWYDRVGEQDITADVDWTAIALAAERAGMETLGLVTQRRLLAALGVDEDELTNPARLGTAFQAYGARTPGLPSLPGF